MRRLAVFMLLLAVVAGACGDAAPANEKSYGPVWVEGSLPPLPDAGADPAVGMEMPAIVGTGLEGEAVRIEADGTAKIVVLLAHWCPHCQNEVPVITDWIEAGEVPDGVAVYGLATGTTEERPNYPPGAWLAREGWPAPTVFDDRDGTAGRALGLTGFPFFVFVDADGRVAGRIAGAIPIEQLAAIADQVAP